MKRQKAIEKAIAAYLKTGDQFVVYYDWLAEPAGCGFRQYDHYRAIGLGDYYGAIEIREQDVIMITPDEYFDTGEPVAVWTLDNVRQYLSVDHVRQLLAYPEAVEAARAAYAAYISVPAGRRDPVDLERYPRPGDLMLDSLGHVSVAVECDPTEVVLTEAVGPEKSHYIDLYTQWLRDGYRQPPISVIETTYHKAGSLNSRRLLAMQAAGVDRAIVWYSPLGERRQTYGRFYLVEYDDAAVSKLHIMRRADGANLACHFDGEDLAQLEAAGC